MFIVIALLSGCSSPTPALQPTQPGEQSALPADEAGDIFMAAQAFVDQLASGDFAAATSRFDPTMKAAAPEAKLKEIWNQLLGQVGAYQKQLGIHTDTQQGYRRVFVTSQFEQAVIDVLVVFDAQGQISGLFFQPGQAPDATPQTYNPPGYVKEGAFHELEVTVGNGKWALPGSLALPYGEGPFPALVLVHGSGPNDRDETIGPNKPFRDLAWGMASQGIAVLRYDKRTKVHASQFTPEIQAELTVQEETIQDALLAVRILRETERIDPQRIFVAGHSLGAYLAPRIGQQDPYLAGLIILSGPTRPLEDLVLDQVTYLSNLDGMLTDKEKADLATLQAQVDRVKAPDLSDQVASTDLPLGIPPAYWLDLRGYQPAEVAQTLDMPLLVMQGGRDYQVVAEKDFAGWQVALEGRANATLKLYPELNHLLIAGAGPSTPQEYNVAGHVSEDLLNDIGAWVMKN